VAVAAHPPAGDPLDDHVVGRLDQQRGGELALLAAQGVGERLGLRRRAREAVEQEPVLALLLDLLEDHGDHQVVGDELALLHVLLGLRPQLGAVGLVLAQQVAGADVGQPEVVAQAARPACPFRPGRTKRMRLSSLIAQAGSKGYFRKAFVVAHHQLRLELLHRVQRDADHDQQRGAAEVEALRGAGGGDDDGRQRGHRRQVERAGQRQAGQDAVQELGRRPAWPHPRDEAAVLLQVVRLVDRVERDRGVEVREEDDHDRLAAT
jgi:hypothetical protein